MKRESIVREIYAALQRANELRGPEAQLVCAEETCLYGSRGALDSLGLVSLILDVEEAVNTRTGQQLVLADEHAMGQKRNPFRSVQALADYILARLEEGDVCATAQ
jgi:acyl carrier protein